MALGVILTVLIIIITAFVVHKLLQEALDLLHIGVSVAGIIIAILLVMVVADAISFKRSFSSSDNLLAIKENESIVTAFVLKGSSSGANAGRAEKLSEAELSNLAKHIAAKDYKAALGENYKLVLLKKDAIEAAAQNGIMANGRNYSSSEAIEALETGNADVLKALVTKMTNSPSIFIPHYKKGNIYVYPESQMFKVIKYAPVFGMDAIKGVVERLGRVTGLKNEA
ncbi:hypothetical protein HYV82_02990 [Candidatus Woesearchaeota archaeon]|nr:hypothetical protein [Candidatus Woesearchaeota archaeon]